MGWSKRYTGGGRERDKRTKNNYNRNLKKYFERDKRDRYINKYGYG